MIDQGFCFCCVGALEAHNNRYAHCAQRLISLYHTLGHPVTAYDPSENIDQNNFYFFIL